MCIVRILSVVLVLLLFDVNAMHRSEVYYNEAESKMFNELMSNSEYMQLQQAYNDYVNKKIDNIDALIDGVKKCEKYKDEIVSRTDWGKNIRVYDEVCSRIRTLTWAITDVLEENGKLVE